MGSEGSVQLFVCGDVMTGRGIDQALPRPADPVLYESYVRDARDYVALAERASGPIPRPASFDYVWGDALAELDQRERASGAPWIRIVNLETSITADGRPWPGKAIHYRMNPENIGCLTAARIHCCCLANNHVLDWGYDGLEDTLRTLDAAGIRHAGAGREIAAASAPAVLDPGAPGGARVLVLAAGSTTSGIPERWRATRRRPGVFLLEDLSDESARRVADLARERRTPGDVVVVSVHWGPNWGYRVPPEQVRFARALVEGGVDVVHGHSSHHVKSLEVYRDRPILYGCGDFLNDYEGIGGYEEFRSDLRLMYLVTLGVPDGRLLDLRLVPLQAHRFRLRRASRADTRWLCDLLNRLGAPFETRVEIDGDQDLVVRWGRSGPPAGAATARRIDDG